MQNTILKEKVQKIYEEYVNYIYRGALFLTQSKELADDITQDVFVQVINKYDTYDETKPIKPWLYKIMLNKVRNTVSRTRYMQSLDEMVETVGCEQVEERIIQEDESRALWHQIEKLSIRTKEVIYMHFYLDMTLEETAKVLDIPLGTCKSRLGAGLKRLRSYKTKEIGSRHQGVAINE